ncbi:MAG: hypothetical protein ACRDD5_01260 [Silvania sp.]|uniref:hypothetical protein n=1 Tax=Silvania sp. TaxID=3016633 RepID=UPI003EE68C85
MAQSEIIDEGVFTIQGAALAEALSIIDEYNAIAEARETYRLSQPIPTAEVRGKTLHVSLGGIEIGTVPIYRGKNVSLNGIVTSQSKAVAHLVNQYKLQQENNHDSQ